MTHPKPINSLSKIMTNSPLTSIILLIPVFTITSLLPTNNAYSKPISKEQIGLKDEQQTQLSFYYHDTLSGSNPTSLVIASASGATKSPSTFGALSMTDAPLTETADASSKLVGRAQGLYAMADQTEFANINMMNLLFIEGDYNGSTLSVLGRATMKGAAVNELPVVGGTGAFRFAKGYIQAKTHSFDQKTGDSVVEYTVVVSHVGSSSSTGGSSSSSPKASHASLSNLVSFTFLIVPVLYLCVV